MAHSYTSLKYHIVFGTKYRMPFISAEFEAQLYAYIGGVIRRKGGQIVSIGGVEDHVHILASLHQSRSLAAMVAAIKSNSSSFGKELFNNSGFAWQRGYAAFSVSESQVPRLKRYLQNQKEHHSRVTYESEVRQLCSLHGFELESSFFEAKPGSET